MFEAFRTCRSARKKDYETLHAEATRRRRARDWNGAIACLRAANRKADSRRVTSTIEEHLRLPSLLQESGRLDEAVAEFRRLLDHGYPGQLDNPNVRWTDRSIIYDTMSLAFERAQRPREAVICGALFFVTDAYSRFLDTARLDYEEDVCRMRSRAASEAWADHLLARIHDGMLRDELADVLQQAVCRFQNAEIEAILQDVEERLRARLAISGD